MSSESVDCVLVHIGSLWTNRVPKSDPRVDSIASKTT